MIVIAASSDFCDLHRMKPALLLILPALLSGCGFHPRDTLKLAENTAQVFMGMRIQCAQCHNHPFERWTQDDYYGFASFFSQVSARQDPRTPNVPNAKLGRSNKIYVMLNGWDEKTPRLIGDVRVAAGGRTLRPATADCRPRRGPWCRGRTRGTARSAPRAPA